MEAARERGVSEAHIRRAMQLASSLPAPAAEGGVGDGDDPMDGGVAEGDGDDLMNGGVGGHGMQY